MSSIQNPQLDTTIEPIPYKIEVELNNTSNTHNEIGYFKTSQDIKFKDNIVNSAHPFKKSNETSIPLTQISTFPDNNIENMNMNMKLNINKQDTSTLTDKSVSSSIKKYNSNNILLNSLVKREHMRYSNLEYPYMRISIDMTVTSREIYKIISEILKANSFFFKFCEYEYDIFAYKKESDLMKTLLNCFRSSEAGSCLIELSFIITPSSINKYERTIECVGLKGRKEVIVDIFSLCYNSILRLNKKMKIVRINNIKQDVEKKDMIYERSNVVNKNFLIEETNLIENLNKETATLYEINKILSYTKYEQGKQLKISIEKFILENRKIKEKSKEIPNQMKEIISLTEETYDSFNCYYNRGNNSINNDKTSKSLKNSIETYVFNKIYHLLYELYDEKYRDINEKFVLEQKYIKNKNSYIDIMKDLDINKKFIPKESSSFPFQVSVDMINKIEFILNIRDKFETLMKAMLEMKTLVLEITEGKIELESADDELPLTIFIMTQVNLKNVFAELNMIDDYLKYSRDCIDRESKVVINIKCSIEFICDTYRSMVDEKRK